MPRVPDFSAQASSSGFSPPAFAAPNVQNAAPQQLQRLGEQFERAGNVAGDVAMDMQKRINHDVVTDGLNQTMAELTKLQVEAEQLKGKNALDRPDGESLPNEYVEKFKKSRDSIEQSTIKNDAQRALFREQTDQHAEQLRAKLTGHMVKETVTHGEEVRKGTKTVATNNIAALPYDPDSVKFNLGVIAETVRQQAEIDGVAGDKDIMAIRLQADLSPAHMIVISSALNENKIAYATEYFKQHSAELTPDARLRATAALEQGNNEMVAGAAVRELTSSGEWNIADIDKQLVERFKDNPKGLDAARSELKYQSGLRDAATEQKEAELYKPVYDLLGSATQSGRSIPRSEIATVLAPLRTSNPEAYAKAAKMLDAHNEKVRNAYEAVQAKARANSDRYGAGSSEAQIATWYELKTDPKALKTVNLLSMLNAGAISHKQFTQLVEEQQTLISAKGGQAKEDTLLSDKAAIEGVYRAAYGIEAGGKIDPATMGKFAEKFDARVRTQSNGKEFPQAEKLKIARELLQEVVTKKGTFKIFDETKKAFEIDEPPAQKPQAAAPKYGSRSVSGAITPKINPTDRAQIVAYLKSKNLPVNNENIYAIYKVGGGE